MAAPPSSGGDVGGGCLVTEPTTTTTTQVEVFQWLRNLPLAPEYHPTLQEFQDPISYIFKIEKEASQYGICKIVPPVLSAPKKTAILNLNCSLENSTFTTRQQQIGFCPRKPRPMQKPVWESGETYTFHEFEAKAKIFERSYLKKCTKKGAFVSARALFPLEMETLYWKATVDKPFSVEYANDMPGSAFSVRKSCGGDGALGEGVTVGETEWNMRSVSRAKGSLLRFMKEEIPGVTSPMVYIAMMFSWFAWHVEDHDLHSLNYMHLGAPKTWYGVPREAAVAFEEVVRIHGYGGEINPLVTFSVLGEKTTVMSPELLISSGVPCCRLVQNAGEFVVTFPRAYHSGFSHGFNCGEAANIATPEWLTIAKDAAIRRASVNCRPMVSHFQLLYDLAMELSTRVPINIRTKPRSSRLKDKQKCGGETMVKELFVKNIIRNNDLFHALGKGSPVLLLPLSSSDVSVSSNSRVGHQLSTNHPSLRNSHISSSIAFSRQSASNSINPVGDNRTNKMISFFTVKQKFESLYGRNAFFSLTGNGNAHSMRTKSEKGDTDFHDRLPDQRLFSCVTCGILSFDCVAVIQPKEQAARYLMSADCSFFNDWTVGSGLISEGLTAAVRDTNTHEHNSSTILVEKNAVIDICIASGQSVNPQIQKVEQSREESSYTSKKRETSALGLLAQTYGNFSDSEDDDQDDEVARSASHWNDDSIMNCNSENKYQSQPLALSSIKQECHKGEGVTGSDSEVPRQTINCYTRHSHKSPKVNNASGQAGECSFDSEADNLGPLESNGLDGKFRDPEPTLPLNSPAIHARRANLTDASFAQRSDEGSSCLHVFCLEHAVEAEQQLRSIGGVHIMLLCHPDYPRMEVEAKSLSDELSIDHIWNDITFKEATEEDEERIQLALNNEESIPGNGDWTVKLGINLSYSAYLSWSPLYSKQMAYNGVIYSAFGRASPASLPTGFGPYEQRPSRQRKMVEGKWCGKTWMSNQVHPFLINQDLQDQEVEHERVNHVRPLSDEKLRRKPQNMPTISAPRMYQRKRNARAEIRPLKKAKCMEKGVSSDDAMEDIYDKQTTRVLCNKRSSGFEREVSDDSLEENSDDNHGRIRITMQANSSTDTQVSVSDDSLGDKSYRQYGRVDKLRAKSFERANPMSNALSKKNLQKQQRSTHKWIREDAMSDDAILDNSLEENVQQQCRRFHNGKQAKYIDNEDAASDELPDCGSRKLKRRNFNGKQVKGRKQEDLSSDNSQEESVYMQHLRCSKIKQAKFSEKEDANSEDSSHDSVYQRTKRVAITKQAEFFQWKNAASDDSLDSAYKRHRRDCSRKKKTFTESEDAVSDESDDDDGNQRLRRIPKGKRTKVIEKEDPESDYRLENSASWQSRKASRGKQAKFIEEDTVSEDLSDDIPSQRNKRIAKSRRKKSKSLQLVKQEANCDAKRVIATSKIINKRTPRRQKDKNQTYANKFDSPAEEDSEVGPSSRLRRRPAKALETKAKAKQQTIVKKAKNASATKGPGNQKKTKLKDEEGEYQCNVEGCNMSFGTKYELRVHKKNICPVKGCGKNFFSHKYLVQHRRVHMDDRPLKCPWNGCQMTFKWAWARTEHIRVHTGARPYVCAEEGCGQTFRFVSDFSRHKRKTGHSARKKEKNC